MATQKVAKPAHQQEMTGAERLGLRVSSMINHPVAQIQRWVVIHQLETDAQQDWEGILDILAATDGIDLTFNDDETVTLRWAKSDDEPPMERSMDVEASEAPAPF